MTDNLSNNIPTPFTPSGTPSVLPDSPPPPEVAVDPIPPLPSMSASAANQPSKFGDPEPKVETVIEPDPPKPVEKPVTPPIPPTPSVPEENPAIRPPGAQSAVGDNSKDPYVKKHHGLPKTIIAGIASLVFLVVALGSGLYLVRQRQDIRPFAANFADQDAVTKQRFESDWGDKAQEQWERERQLFEATGGEQNSGLWGGSSDQQTVQDFWDSGVNNNQASEEQRHEVVTEAQQAKEQALQQGVSEAEAAQAAKQAVKELEAPGVSPPGGTGVISGDAGGCYGMGNRDLEAQCIAGAKSGQYTSGSCRTGNCLSGGYVVYCRGPQESAESPRAGEFLTCGLQFNSTGGCGQADVYASKGAYDNSENPIGFIIDKSGCVSQPPQVTTEEAPLREFPPEPTPPPGATATPTPATISANCESLVGQMSNGSGGWTTKTDAEFAVSARPGDGVRFVCTGHKTQGAFTKAAFFINGTLHVDDVVKLNADQYAVEYTIPVAGSLEVESVLLHDSKGWVD